MSGWLVRVTLRGVDPTTRRITELWAAWVKDAVDAVSAVEERSGVTDPPAETIQSLSDDLLADLGLEVGLVARVKADF